MMKAFGSMVLSECEEKPVLGTQLLLRCKLDSGEENTVKRLNEGLNGGSRWGMRSPYSITLSATL